MDNFKIVCPCGNEDILTKDQFDLLDTKNNNFFVEVNVHSCQLEIKCKKCGNKFAGGG